MIWTDARRKLALECAETWSGTPWANRRASIGRGVDCIHFVLAVLVTAEIIPEVQLPYYKPSLGFRADSNVMESIIRQCLHVESADAPTFGDLLIWKCGESSNHIGIMLDHPWHVRTRGIVSPTPYETIAAEMQSILRITEPGLASDPCRLTNM